MPHGKSTNTEECTNGIRARVTTLHMPPNGTIQQSYMNLFVLGWFSIIIIVIIIIISSEVVEFSYFSICWVDLLWAMHLNTWNFNA